MADKIQCATHRESDEAFVCTHLLGQTAGLGFNRNDPTADDPFPDAWCDDCELIRAAHNGWNEESEKLLRIRLLCSHCYERARIRNTKTNVTLDDLGDLRWKCGSCEEWHTGPCLDFGYVAPHYWLDEYKQVKIDRTSGSSHEREHPNTFLNENYCAIKAVDFFVRGIIHLPIIGTAETLRWGVWRSLSHDNFEALMRMDSDPKRRNARRGKRVELPGMFSWLSTKIPEYPDTLNLKMYAHIQDLDRRPHFELESTDHLLAREHHHGIDPQRVKEIMTGRLRDVRTGG